MGAYCGEQEDEDETEVRIRQWKQRLKSRGQESRNADNFRNRANRRMLSWNLQKELQSCSYLDFSIMKLMLNL